MVRKSLLEGVRHGVWGRLGDGEERGAGPTEGNAVGTGRIAGRNGRRHARDEGGTIGLVQTVIHGWGQESILSALQGMHEQGRATTVKDGISPAHLGGQDSACLRGGELEVGYGDDQGKF